MIRRFCCGGICLIHHLDCHRTARSSGAQYREAVGSDESDADILLKGERVWNLEKKFNIAAGVEKDTLPPRLLREHLPEGPAKGKVNDLYTMLAEYYQVRGWDAEGVPTPDKEKELGL